MFLPKICKVGFQERDSTYTGKLAYVIYYDENGKLRKEVSWESWRSHKIDSLDIENIPTSGFVLNKKVGGYSSGWNHRSTYTRVYDPRGFEFEISVENLLYILDHCDSMKGKGLQGEFVYGYEGKDLVLVPVSDPSYKTFKELSDNLFNPIKIKTKDLVIGNTYQMKNQEKRVYLGRQTLVNGEKSHIFTLEDEIKPILTKGAVNIILDLGDYNFDKLEYYNMMFEMHDKFMEVDYDKNVYYEITPNILIEAFKSRRTHLHDYSQRKPIIGSLDYYDILRDLGSKFAETWGKEKFPYIYNSYKTLPRDFVPTILQADQFIKEHSPKILLKKYFKNGELYEERYSIIEKELKYKYYENVALEIYEDKIFGGK